MPDQQIIMIKCPNCGAVLSVRNQQGIESKNVPCPSCHQRMPFSSFQRVVPRKKNVAGTIYPSGYEKRNPQLSNPVANNNTIYRDTRQVSAESRPKIGCLCLQPTGQMFQLSEGRNIIGRQASQTEATIQIPVPSMRMSREHLVIDVKYEPGKGYLHVASLFKPKYNKTTIDGQELQYGDSIVLKSGCRLDLPDATLVFQL